MSSTEVRVPLGVASEGEEIVVANWLVDDQGAVDVGETVVELMVTKVTFEVTATSAGRLQQRAAVEDVVSVGDLLGVIEAL